MNTARELTEAYKQKLKALGLPVMVFIVEDKGDRYGVGMDHTCQHPEIEAIGISIIDREDEVLDAYLLKKSILKADILKRSKIQTN